MPEAACWFCGKSEGPLTRACQCRDPAWQWVHPQCLLQFRKACGNITNCNLCGGRYGETTAVAEPAAANTSLSADLPPARTPPAAPPASRTPSTLPRARRWHAQKVELWDTSTHELSISLKSSLSQLETGGAAVVQPTAAVSAAALTELPPELLWKVLSHVPISTVFGMWCSASAQTRGAKLDISVWTAKLRRANITVNEKLAQFDGQGWVQYMKDCLYCGYRYSPHRMINKHIAQAITIGAECQTLSSRSLPQRACGCSPAVM